MPRINIDDNLYFDPRFKALTKLLNSEEMALGRMVVIFRMAQKYYVDDKKLIPIDIWEMQGFDDVEKVGLAERRENGIYVKGSEQYFDWLIKIKAKSKKGGVKSAAIRKQKYGTAQPKTQSENVKDSTISKPHRSVHLNNLRTTPNPLNSLLPLPDIHIDPSTGESSYARARAAPVDKDVDNFLNVYCTAMEKHYGKRPLKTSKLIDLATEIIAEVGLDRSVALAGHFCASNREYYVKRMHSLDVMLADLAILDMCD